MSSIDGPRSPHGDLDDPPRVDRLDDPADPVARARAARTVPLPRVEADGSQVETPDVIEELREPDNRAKLLLVIAGLCALTFLLVLVNTITLQSRGGDEPVVVDGVPCLVDEGPGEEAVLYCQR